jgi:AraC-like DNA-binding protein
MVLEKLYTAMDSTTTSSELMQISLVYKFFSILFDCSDVKNELNYANAAKTIIDYNFSNGLTVGKLANELCLNTAYFTRLFTKCYGIPPKQYIIEKQISKAKALLAHFGTLAAMRKASAADIASVRGISLSDAENVYAFLHDADDK